MYISPPPPNKYEMPHLYSGLEYKVLLSGGKIKAHSANFKVIFIALKINKETFTSEEKIWRLQNFFFKKSSGEMF